MSSIEMKVTTKKSSSFYCKAAKAFFTSVDARDGTRKEAVSSLVITGIGGAINVAVEVAAAIETAGLGTIQNVQTSYPKMGASTCARIAITVMRSMSVSHTVHINYSTPPPAPKKAGRYMVGDPEGGPDADVFPAIPSRMPVQMHNARVLAVPAELEKQGFELHHHPTAVHDFENDDEVVKTYYDEMRDLVKKATGAQHVLIFDHTLRSTGSANVSSLEGKVASTVSTVHADYTETGGPLRLSQLAKDGVNSLELKRQLSEEEMLKYVANRRYAIVNVWRGITDEPVQQMPLACCDVRSVREEDRIMYYLKFPDRTGENYLLKTDSSLQHKWYYYPEMIKDECLLFKTFDSKSNASRFCFHTAFEDPKTRESAPARKSIEVRCMAFFPDGSKENGRDGHECFTCADGTPKAHRCPHE